MLFSFRKKKIKSWQLTQSAALWQACNYRQNNCPLKISLVENIFTSKFFPKIPKSGLKLHIRKLETKFIFEHLQAPPLEICTSRMLKFFFNFCPTPNFCNIRHRWLQSLYKKICINVHKFVAARQIFWTITRREETPHVEIPMPLAKPYHFQLIKNRRVSNKIVHGRFQSENLKCVNFNS